MLGILPVLALLHYFNATSANTVLLEFWCKVIAKLICALLTDPYNRLQTHSSF